MKHKELHQAQSFSLRTCVKDTIIFQNHSFPFYNPVFEDLKHLRYISVAVHIF